MIIQQAQGENYNSMVSLWKCELYEWKWTRCDFQVGIGWAQCSLLTVHVSVIWICQEEHSIKIYYTYFPLLEMPVNIFHALYSVYEERKEQVLD